MEFLETILKDVENKEELVNAIKKELPKNFIPKDQFNEKNEELKTTKAKMEELQASVTELEKYTNENTELKSKIDSLKGEYQNFKNEADNRVQAIQKKQAIERNLVKANANLDAVDLLISQFDIDKMQVDSKGDIVDWDNHFTPIKEARKSLFGEINITGDKPPTGQQGELTNPFAKGEKFNLSEQGKIMRESPERARTLIQSAGLNPANYGF